MGEFTKSTVLPHLLHEKKIRKYLLPVLLILALAAFLSTTAILSKNAETMTKKGMVLDCHYHIQTGEGYAGYVVHVHNEDCYDAAGNLVCELPEIPGHVHDESCWGTENVLTCGLEESDGHVHEESCYGLVRGNLVCGLEEASHAHNESCYSVVRGELVCGLEESEDHQHTDECYLWTEELTCGLEETEGHVHTDDCYEWVEGLVCGLEECEEHHHSESCYETVREPVCGQQGLHTHTPACYDETGALICGQLQLEEHIHGPGCFVVQETDEESDPNADVESYWDYAARFAYMDKTGPWNELLVEVAKTQLGYTESTRNFVIENGEHKGYTRYGAWYGLPYGDWCAMFVSFCLNFAEVPTDAMPIECGVTRWIDALMEKDLYTGAEGYTPKMGDIIFFDYDQDEKGDHVGIVTSVNVAEGTLVTIEGNHNPAVGQFTYALSNPAILGYGILPERPTEEKSESEPAGEDTALALITVADGSPLPENVTIYAYELSGEDAESARHEVEDYLAGPVLPGPMRTMRLQAAQPAAIETETSSETRYEAFEIGLDNMEEAAFEGGFRVSVTLPTALTGRDFALYHLGDAGVETLEAEYESVLNEDGTETVTGFRFVTDSFSPFVLSFTVDFHYEERSASLEGRGQMTLSALFEALGIDKSLSEVTAVEFSDPSLLEVSYDEVTGEWMLTSLLPFETEESLTILFANGDRLRLLVTDFQIRQTVISDSGEAYEITVTYESDSGIPEDADLAVEEILDASDVYSEYVSKTENALGMENGSVRYIRLFDISIVDKYDPTIKYQPAVGTAVDVSIKLTDAGFGKDLRVVHFAGEDDSGSVMNSEVKGKTVSFETSGFSIYAVADETEYKRLVYTFYNGNSVHGREYVTQGQHLYSIGAVESEYGQTFIGWAYSAGETDPSKIYGDVNALDLHLQAANWNSSELGSVVGASYWDTLVTEGGQAKEVPIYAIFKDAYYLRFMNVDEYGNEFVLKTQSVRKDANDAGRTIAFEPPVVSIGEDSGQIVTQWIDVATGTVYDSQTTTSITLNQHIDLYPKVEGQYWLVFNANAGGPGSGVTYTPPQLLRGEEAVTQKPADPVRKGYTFQGWYTNPDGTGQRFTFGSALTEDTILYAKWAPANTDYYVVFWRQKASDEAGLADSEKSYDYIESVHRSDLTDATVSLEDGDRTKNGGEYEHCTFNGTHSQTSATVNADGTTVLNVYYDRKEYTLSFQVYDYTYTVSTHDNDNNPNKYGDVNGQKARIYWRNGAFRTSNRDNGTVYNGTVYTRSSYQSWQPIKTITALYDHSIAGQFPITWNNGTRWLDYRGTYYASNRVLVSIDRMPPADIVFHWSDPESRPTKTMNYYVEALPDETEEYANSIYEAYPYHHKEDVSTTDATCSYSYGGTTRNFAIYNQIKARYNMVTELEDFIEITGFTRWTSDPAYSNGVALNDSNHDGTINMYYTRNQYDLIYVSNVPNSDTPRQEHTEKVYFEASLSGYGQQADGSWFYEPTNGLEGYTFAGWYEDEALTTPYTFDGTMPANNVTIFAKWEPQRVRVVLVPTPNHLHDNEVMFANEQALTFRLDYKEPVNDANITGTAAKRLGYRLAGWYTTPDFKPDSLWNFDTQVHGDVVQTINGVPFYPVNMDYQNTSEWSDNTYRDNPDNKGVVHSEVKGILKLYAKWELDIDTNSVYVDYEVPEAYRVYDALGNLQTTIPVDDAAYVIDNGKITTTIKQAPSEYSNFYRFKGWQLLDADGNPVENAVYQPGGTQDIPQQYFSEKVMTDDNGDPILDGNGQPVVMKYVKLVAVFDPISDEDISTVITYDGNGGTTTDTHEESYSENHPVNEDIQIPGADSFEREGYTMVGWAFDPNLSAEDFRTIINSDDESIVVNDSTKSDVFLLGSTVFADNEDRTVLNTRNNTLYAIWEPRTYTVTVKKVVVGTDEGESFGFTATASGDYTLSSQDASFALAHGGEKVIADVPYGTVLTFTENPASHYSIQSVDAKQTSLPDNTALEEAQYIDLGGADGKAFTIKGDTVITYYNIRDQLVSVWKTDMNHNTLTGAKFVLYRAEDYDDAAGGPREGAVPIIPSTEVGSNGILTLGNLMAGEYRLVETQAPDGYNLAESAIRIVVSADSVTALQGNTYAEVAQNVEGNAYRQYWVNGQDDDTWQIRVWNNAGVVLPSTGGPGIGWIRLLGLVLTVASCTVLILRRKRKAV